jgi:enoyl-[acyl-carrier-protein] reductase (NADH)
MIYRPILYPLAARAYTSAESHQRILQASLSAGLTRVCAAQVHCLANGPEVKNALLETSRPGYLAALSASAYSFVSMVRHFGPGMNPGGAAITLSYLAAQRVIPGYGGGMSSAKAVSWGGVGGL